MTKGKKRRNLLLLGFLLVISFSSFAYSFDYLLEQSSEGVTLSHVNTGEVQLNSENTVSLNDVSDESAQYFVQLTNTEKLFDPDVSDSIRELAQEYQYININETIYRLDSEVYITNGLLLLPVGIFGLLSLLSYLSIVAILEQENDQF